MSKKETKTIQPKQITAIRPAASQGAGLGASPGRSEPGSAAGSALEGGLPAAAPGAPKLPPELEKKLKALKEKLDSFKDKVLDKFGDYIVGIALLPPEKPLPPDGGNERGKEGGRAGEKSVESEKEAAKESGKEAAKDSAKDLSKEEQKINVLVVVDDTTSEKMTKDELHHKFSTIITKMAEEVDKNIAAQSILLTDLWMNCYDGKYDLNRLI